MIKKLLTYFLLLWLLIQYNISFAFFPQDIWNNVFHFDMNNLDGDDNSATQPGNNQSIQTLLDQANSHTGSQSNITKQAKFDSGAFKNRWALLFDGLNDLYTLEDHSDITNSEEFQQKSFAVVVQTSNNISSLQTIYEQWAKDKWYAIQIENGKLYVWVWNTISWPNWEQFKIADLWEIQQNQAYNIIMTQNSSADNTLQVYLNGNLVKNILNVSAQTSHGSCTLSGSFDCYLFANGWSIGIWATKNETLRLSNSTQQAVEEDHFYQWHIWELISWNSSLSQQDAMQLFGYFDTKWWITQPEISIQTPAEVGSVNIWDSKIYITYNDFQNGNSIDINSDDIKLYKWTSGVLWNDISDSYINSFTKIVSAYEAKYDLVGMTKWKYRLEFSISKSNWESSTSYRDFYVWELLPNEVPNPVFHYDAQDINGNNNFSDEPWNNSRVTTWVDKFNWFNAQQSTNNLKPRVSLNTINGFQAIWFDGSTQYFDIANQTEINTRRDPLYDEKSFAAVFKTWNDVNTFQTIYEQGWNIRWYSFVIDQWYVYAWVWNTNEWDNGHKYKSVNLWIAQPNTTYFAMIVQDSQYAQDEQNTLKIYLNGNLSSVQDHTDPQNRHTWAISIWRVNGNSVSASTNTVVSSSWDYFNGHLWELISWNFALDQADVNGIQEYFSQKWWIVLFSEKYPIPTPTSDATPSYTFVSNRSGTLQFSGSCNSTATQAVVWENIITLSSDALWNDLNVGIYDDCIIELLDDNGYSHVLNITPFEVIATSYTLTEVQPISSPTSNHFPEYTFESPIEWQIEYFWSCNSNTQYAVIWNNTITLNYLADGIYDNCYLKVNNGWNQQSEYLLISSFEIRSQAPVFWNSTIQENQILAKWNKLLQINYTDSSGINTSSAQIQLQKFDSLSQNWWNDISNSFMTQNNISQNQAEYQLNIPDFWRYRIIFEIENIHGAKSTFSREFYIDNPALTIDSSQLNIGDLNSQNINYSLPIAIQVETIWAEFDLKIKKNQDLTSHNNTIQEYNSSSWYGYDLAPMWSGLNTISSVETFANQSKNININGQKNIYTYYVRLWAIIDQLQSAWEYTGDIKFWIELKYD